MEKQKTFRDDPTYVRIEKKWHDAYRRRDRAYDAYIRPRVADLDAPAAFLRLELHTLEAGGPTVRAASVHGIFDRMSRTTRGR
jgi:hypothetical protein